MFPITAYVKIVCITPSPYTTTVSAFETAGMPAPAAAAAITVAAIASAVALGYAFTKFVYEPHLAPKLEQWAEEFLATREARRRQRAGAGPVLATPHMYERHSSNDSGEGGETLVQLENLGSRDPHAVLTSPTHVIVDPSVLFAPSPTTPSIGASPSVPLREVSSNASSSATLLSPPPNLLRGLGLLPTPTPSSTLSSAAPQHPPHSPGMIPSLSQSFPLELDQEHGIELLSAPSSRPESPFSAFSQPLSPSLHSTNLASSHYYSFSSPSALPPDNITSPSARPPSRGFSELDFLSDLSSDHDVLSPPWSDARVLTQEPRQIDDGLSDSSWTSGGARSR
ncbi:hypothetical protein C0993_007492 [Termitomyces sp. T159_Od127]|nr:hypothetical protein C0993_007492 [Termitomyces sp. T159_Od127]